MANNGSKFPIPKVPDLSREEISAWNWIANHPLLDGQLIEDITLSTTTKHTRVPHALGRAYRGFIDVRGVGLTEDQANPNKDKEIWLYREASPVLLDEVTLTTAATSVRFSNLDGDAEVEYTIEMDYDHVQNGNVTLQPEGISTGQTAVSLGYDSTATASAGASSILLINRNSDGFLWAKFYAKTGGTYRYAHSIFISSTTAVSRQISSVWSDTTTPITYLDIVHDTASGINAGTNIRLYARHSRATKSSIWIF